MPPQRSRARTGRREATFLLPEEWPEAGAWLSAAVEQGGTPKRKVLTAMQYVGGTNRLNSYFRGTRLPKPATLQCICNAARISYVEAVDRFGYYREIVRIFDDLVWLGDRWMDEDDAYGRAIRLDADRSITIDARMRTMKRDGTKLPRIDTIRFTGVLY